MINVKVKSQSASWLMGYDAGKNGANERNSHFKYFSTKSSLAEWESGKKEGAIAKQKIKN